MKLIKFEEEVQQEQQNIVEKIINLINTKQLNQSAVSVYIDYDKKENVENDLSMNLGEIINKIQSDEFAKYIYATTIANVSLVTHYLQFKQKQLFVCTDLMNKFGINTYNLFNKSHSSSFPDQSNKAVHTVHTPHTPNIPHNSSFRDQSSSNTAQYSGSFTNSFPILPQTALKFDVQFETNTEINKQIPTNVSNVTSLSDKLKQKPFTGYMIGRVIFDDISYNIYDKLSPYCKFMSMNLDESLYYFCIIIDTDQTENLKKLQNSYKHKKHIIIKNHMQFQQWFITKYE